MQHPNNTNTECGGCNGPVDVDKGNLCWDCLSNTHSTIDTHVWPGGEATCELCVHEPVQASA